MSWACTWPLKHQLLTHVSCLNSCVTENDMGPVLGGCCQLPLWILLSHGWTCTRNYFWRGHLVQKRDAPADISKPEPDWWGTNLPRVEPAEWQCATLGCRHPLGHWRLNIKLVFFSLYERFACDKAWKSWEIHVNSWHPLSILTFNCKWYEKYVFFNAGSPCARDTYRSKDQLKAKGVIIQGQEVCVKMPTFQLKGRSIRNTN